MTDGGVRCPGCGAALASAEHCGYCGGAASYDGHAGQILPSDLNCPRCDDKPALKGVVHDSARADVCFTCHGAWLDFGVLEELLREAEARERPPVSGRKGPERTGIEPVRYARCPCCDGGMARTAVSRKPLVFIDRCPSHGDWLDGGELGQLKSLARSRGVDVLLDLQRPKRIPRTRRELEGGGKDIADPSDWIMPEVLGVRGRRTDLFDILGAVFGDL